LPLVVIVLINKKWQSQSAIVSSHNVFFLGKLLERERVGGGVINTSEVVFTMDRLKEN
jgi:hypothetical protein